MLILRQNYQGYQNQVIHTAGLQRPKAFLSSHLNDASGPRSPYGLAHQSDEICLFSMHQNSQSHRISNQIRLLQHSLSSLCRLLSSFLCSRSFSRFSVVFRCFWKRSNFHFHQESACMTSFQEVSLFS